MTRVWRPIVLDLLSAQQAGRLQGGDDPVIAGGLTCSARASADIVAGPE